MKVVHPEFKAPFCYLPNWALRTIIIVFAPVTAVVYAGFYAVMGLVELAEEYKAIWKTTSKE